ncbi:MAG: hypothetical protein JWN04_5454 [Myxococcaceae bacterium]|nr:hypothetical protein [Myxococcaceae bacterium]
MTSCVWQSLKVFVAISVLVGFARSAHAETSAASLGVRSLDGEDELERRLSGALRASVKGMGDFAVIDREASLEQLSLVNGCDDPEAPSCLSQIARSLPVDKLFYGTVVGQNGGYELTLYQFDASAKGVTPMAAHGVPADLLSPANVVDTVDKVLRRLLGKDAPEPVAASTGKLRIEGGVPGTELLVDGTRQGPLDDQGLLLLELAEGRHTVRPAGSDYDQSDERAAVVEVGREVTLSLAPVTAIPVDDELPPSLDETPAPAARSPIRLRRTLGYASIGLGVAFAIATVYSWARIAHINHEGSFREYRQAFPKAGTTNGVSDVCGPAARGELAAMERTQAGLEQKAHKLCSEADKLEALQYVFLAGAVVGGGVGTYLLLSGRDKPSTPTTLSLNPRIGAQNAGLAATLSF